MPQIGKRRRFARVYLGFSNSPKAKIAAQIGQKHTSKDQTLRMGRTTSGGEDKTATESLAASRQTVERRAIEFRACSSNKLKKL